MLHVDPNIFWTVVNLLILFILPSLLALLDRWVTPKKKD